MVGTAWVRSAQFQVWEYEHEQNHQNEDSSGGQEAGKHHCEGADQDRAGALVVLVLVLILCVFLIGFSVCVSFFTIFRLITFFIVFLSTITFFSFTFLTVTLFSISFFTVTLFTIHFFIALITILFLGIVFRGFAISSIL